MSRDKNTYLKRKSFRYKKDFAKYVVENSDFKYEDLYDLTIEQIIYVYNKYLKNKLKGGINNV